VCEECKNTSLQEYALQKQNKIETYQQTKYTNYLEVKKSDIDVKMKEIFTEEVEILKCELDDGIHLQLPKML
jgi:hypothetical protein